MVCESVAMLGTDGLPDPCDVAACQSCEDACDGPCAVAMSFPVQYMCEGEGSWSVYDACPDWQMPNYDACDDVLSTVTSDDLTALGFSADEVLAALTGPFESDAEWVAEEGRANTTVTFAVVANGDPVFHDRAPAGTSAAQCQDLLEVPITLSFSSGDGAFGEQIDTAIWAMDLTALSASAAIDWQALDGSFTFSTVVPADWDTVTIDLSTMLTPALNGQVQVSANRETGPSTGEGMVGPLLRWPPM